MAATAGFAASPVSISLFRQTSSCARARSHSGLAKERRRIFWAVTVEIRGQAAVKPGETVVIDVQGGA